MTPVAVRLACHGNITKKKHLPKQALVSGSQKPNSFDVGETMHNVLLEGGTVKCKLQR